MLSLYLLWVKGIEIGAAAVADALGEAEANQAFECGVGAATAQVSDAVKLGGGELGWELSGKEGGDVAP